ncbi:MAG: TIGR02253 family HAD-type hydrolase [Candidatus Hydrothermarchaeales archaeon]
MFKGVFFDIDDTLYDSTKLSTMARKNAIQAMVDAGLPVENEKVAYGLLERIITKYGSNYSKHYDRLLEELKLEWNPKIVASGVVAYERTKVGYLRPYPKVIPTLFSLKGVYQLGVISNGLAVKQWEKLIGLGLHHVFEIVATSEDVGYEKPHVEIFENAMDRAGLEPKECVMVGDRLDTDIAGAKMVGMFAVRVIQGKFSDDEPSSEEDTPDAVITDISELRSVLGGKGE